MLFSSRVKYTHSYSGYGKNKGVVPLYCEDLFVKMAELQKENPDNQYQVFITFQIRNTVFSVKGLKFQPIRSKKALFSILIG